MKASLIDPYQIASYRESVAESLLFEIGMILFKIDTTVPGRLVETVIQLLPDSTFEKLSKLVVGQKDDIVAGKLIFALAVRLADKLGFTIKNSDVMMNATANIVALINFDGLRRRGHIEYVWCNDIFSEFSGPGFSRLTDSGKVLAQEQLLETFEPQTIQ